jgi:3',5'-cyclic AMP phosphodiesterase CpdA
MRIVHLSDLHFGHHDPVVVEGLAADITSQDPNLVIVSGDFTQNGTEDEFIEARKFLDTLSAPVFAVPGNHDVPQYNLFKRLINPYGLYRRHIAEELEPFLDMGGVAIAGMKTVRRIRFGLNWADGSISREQLSQLEERFSKASPNAVRMIVAHHPLLFPEEQMAKRQRLVKRADVALETFAGLGVRLVMSGHFHMSYVRSHQAPDMVQEAEPDGPVRAARAPILVAQTSSTTSTRLRGHPNAYNLIDLVENEIAITVREWGDNRWTTRERAVESV